MQTIFKVFGYALLFCILLSFQSCSKDDPNENSTDGNENILISETGISETDFERYQGQLGVSISAREIARTGAQPTTAVITSSSTAIDIDTVVNIDPDLNIAQFSFEVEDLTSAQQETISNGVPLTVSIRDENNTEIGLRDFSVISFRSNPQNEEVSPLESLNDNRNNVAFTPGSNYFFQIVDPSSPTGDSAMFVNYSNGGSLEVPLQQRNGYDFDLTNNASKLHLFKMFEIPSQEGVYAISADVTGSDPLLIKIFQNYLIQENSINPENFNLDNLDDATKFVFNRAENGLYTIQTLASNIPLRKRVVSGGTRFHDFGNTNDNLLYVRILSTEIAWTTEELPGTLYLDPILPGATTQISYNSKLSNCSAGVIEDEVGNDASETQSNTTSIEESISMTSTQTSSITASVSATVEASYFGVGASVTAGLSSSLEQQKSITQTTAQGASNTESNELSIFTRRTITIPPGTAAIVNDTYQAYGNIKVPFIKRFRIRGTDTRTGAILNGHEVSTQYLISTGNNSGVIRSIGSDFIEVSVRGTAERAQEIRKTTRADDADPECN